MANTKTVTAADAVLLLTIDSLFPVPIQLQGFATDNIFDTDTIEQIETMMGVDGRLSAGWVAKSVTLGVNLQADSDSNAVFETWYISQQTARTAYVATMIARLPAINRSYALTRGFLKSFPPIPTAAKVLQPRKYTIEFEKMTLAPI